MYTSTTNSIPLFFQFLSLSQLLNSILILICVDYHFNLPGTLAKEGCPYISCHRVDELQTLSSDDQGVHIGSAVTFTMMEDFLTKLKLESKGWLVSIKTDFCRRS